MFSGDNAPDLYWIDKAGAKHSGNTGTNTQNLLSPWIDGGDLNSHFIGSLWTIKDDIVVTGNTAKSSIQFGGLEVDILTTVLGGGIAEQFTFINHDADIASLFFSDYYNFHPNGSLGTDVGCATTSFDGTTVTTTGGTVVVAVPSCRTAPWSVQVRSTAGTSARRLPSLPPWPPARTTT